MCAKFSIPSGALVKRSGAFLRAWELFRREWEDEGGRWSAAEELLASEVQRCQD